MQRIVSLGLLLLAGAGASADAVPGKRELTVAETAGIRRFGYPVHVILDLPGDVTAKDRFRLLAEGKPVAAQFRLLAGQKRKAALDFTVSLGPLEKKRYAVEFGPLVEAGPETKGGMKLEENRETFAIHSGGMVYVVPRNLEGLLGEVRDGQTRYTRPGSAGLGLRTGKRALHSVGGAGFKGQVVRQGPLAVALRFEGETRLPDSKKVTSVVEMTFPRSKSWIEVNWLLSGPDRKAVRALEVALGLRATGNPTLVDFGAGSLVYTTLTKGRSAVLRARASKLRSVPRWQVFTGRGNDLHPFVIPSATDRGGAEGWAHLMDRQRCTALAVDRFGTSRFEDEIRLDADGGVRLRRGTAERVESPTEYRFWLHFVTMPVQVGALTSPQSMKAPLKVEVIPSARR